MRRLLSTLSISIAVGIAFTLGVLWLAEGEDEKALAHVSDSSDWSSRSAASRREHPVALDLLTATAVSANGEPRRLFLVETFPGRTSRQGSARIGVDPRAPQTYSAGALLLNGARVAEIHNQFVVLERSGETYRLELYRARQEDDDTSVSELAVVGGELPEVSPPEPAVDRLSEVLRMAPVYENDLLIAMRLHPGTRRGMFGQLGLQSSDLLVAIDGAPISDPAGMSQLFEPLTRGEHMVLTIKRGNSLQVVMLDGSVVVRELDGGEYASLAR